MRSLEAFGIKLGSDAQHRLMVDIGDFPPGDHFNRAASFLTETSSVVLKEIVPHLEDYPGRWNPGSFMVFPLGLHDELGSLRLHVWPAGLRETSYGPNIHEHGWHLSSLVLVGHYSDNLYKLEHASVVDSGASRAKADLLRLYMTKRNTGGQDALITDGTLVRPKIISERQIPEGQIHHIEAGAYHFTTIPLEQLVVTLVVDSPAFVDATGVLLDSNRPAQIDRRRIQVKHSHVLLAREQIMRHHGLG
ncbi:MAG: hypothetical protein A2698_00550 [Candidatus Levybacteria bacterium RIFCSPHIGHO2_01_FULL_42_15]|nr:MAG: hypothetical protein A2698_00550 [Candidatus Levybacteria bacterium RIFCSPHIGHO2_01_FULL_42_15]